MIYSSGFSSLVGINFAVSYLQPCFITEQVIEFPILFFWVLCRPLTKFPLHFANIHRCSPCYLATFALEVSES
jgi:hypothetical protein